MLRENEKYFAKNSNKTTPQAAGTWQHCLAVLRVQRASEGPDTQRAQSTEAGTHGFPPGMPVRFGGIAGTRM